MTTELRYLRPSVKLEPLFHGWYAWSHLVAPHTAAMHVANGHVKIMRSFLLAPQVHAAAVKNPAMLGGPFIDIEEGRAPEIQAHLDATLARLKPLLDLADAIRVLDALLTEEAKGLSLEPLYARVPDALRGMVELVYDLGGAPSMRFLEGVLYRSAFYDEGLQSIALSLTESDHRAFALSTPRLADPASISLPLPFASPLIDVLARAKREPVDVAALADTLAVPAAQRDLFASFFTDAAPPQRTRWAGPGVRVRYFGHACVLVESKDTTILVDPTASYAYPTELERFTYLDLPERIDYVLVTHNHQDHFLLETLLQIRHQVGEVIVPRGGGGALEDPSLRGVLRALGFTNVRELDLLDGVDVPGGRITAVPFLGEHADLRVESKTAYTVELENFKCLLAADSNNLEPRLYDAVRAAIGPTPVVFIGMECEGAPLSWLYGPLLTRPLTRKMDQSRRLSGSDFEKAKDIVTRLGANEVFVYALGQEPWLGYIMSVQYTDASRPIVCSNELIAFCAGQGIAASRLFAKMEKVYATPT